MPSCDMCGKEGAGAIALIEGVELTVCQNCARFGKITRALHAEAPPVKHSAARPAHVAKPQGEDSQEGVVEEFFSLIRQKREQLNLTQKEFAKMLNERESVIHHLENGGQHPSIELARKLERILKVQLVEAVKETPQQKSRNKIDSLTLGDFIKVKKLS